MIEGDRGRHLAYKDGTVTLAGETFAPVGEANGQAVLVVHEADGIGGNVRRHCRRLAKLGYFALAADMHGGGQPLQGATMASRLAQFRADSDLVRNRVAAAHTALLCVAGVEAPRSAAIGFCFGGFAVLELARSGAPVAAVASFHGLLTTAMPARRGEVTSRVAVYTGARDPLVPLCDVTRFQEEMSKADVDWQVSVYGKALHSFTNADVGKLDDPRMAYDLLSHDASWHAATHFLKAAWIGGTSRSEMTARRRIV